MKTYSLLELAQQIGATIRGNADVVVSNIAPLDKAEKHQLTFISNAKFREKLAPSKAGYFGGIRSRCGILFTGK